MRHWLIVGASRGLGLEFVRQARAAGEAVTATARDDAGLQALQALGARALKLDVADAASAATLGWPLDGVGFDRVALVAGVYGPRHAGLEPPTEAEFDAVMRTNVLGPMRLLCELSTPGVLARGARVLALSSRMGSIGERRSSSGWLYRASKAALNSAVRDAALQWAGRAVCVAVHPGWVQTDMGGAAADLTPQRSVADLRALAEGLKPEDSGGFFNHDGTPIGW